MKKIRIGLFISLMVFLFSCSGKKQESTSSTQSITPPVQTETDNNELTKATEEKKEEKPRKEIKNPLIFYKQYNFTPVEDIDVKSVIIEKTENNNINILCNGILLFSINDIGFEITDIINFCNPHLKDRLYSSSFIIMNDKKQYSAAISFVKGIVNIYNSDNLGGELFFSGYSDSFLVEDFWISKESYYDYKTFKTVPAEFDAELYLIDFDNNEMLYSIESRLLHENVKLSIDKINYEDDGFRVIIGNCMDSDEFVDFKLYTANNDFHYEIFDKYTYER